MTTTTTYTFDLADEQVVRLLDTGGRCPGSYAYDSEEAAWYGLAAYQIACTADGPSDDEYVALDYCVGLAVNGSASLIELIANNWDDLSATVQEHLADGGRGAHLRRQFVHARR